MCNITQDRTIDLANALKDCGCDGNEYRYVQTCTECNGAKKFKKGNYSGFTRPINTSYEKHNTHYPNTYFSYK